MRSICVVYVLVIISISSSVIAGVGSDPIRSTTPKVGQMWAAGRVRLVVELTDPPAAAHEHTISINMVLDEEQTLSSKPASWEEVQGRFGEFEMSVMRPVDSPKTFTVTLLQHFLLTHVLASGNTSISFNDKSASLVTVDLAPQGRVSVEISWLADYEEAGFNGHFVAPLDHDVSAKFFSYYDSWDPKMFPAAYPEAKDYYYLFVKGFGCNLVPTYLHPNRKVLDGLGLQHDTVQMGTQDGCKDNARIIKDTILKTAAASGKKIILISQSKGGSDVATSFVMYWAELEPVVGGVISLNGVLGGTPIVDLFAQGGLTPEVEWLLEKILGGNRTALECMSWDQRNAMYNEFGYPAAHLPTVAITSYSLFRNYTLGEDVWDLYFGIFGKYVRDVFGWYSDGMVGACVQPNQNQVSQLKFTLSIAFLVPTDERFPGGASVRIPNMCHAEGTVQLPGNNWDVAPMQGASLQLLFEEMRGRKRRGL